MGNGVYGFRGAVYPERYPTEDARLSWADALRLNVHPFFNAEQSRSSDSVPLVTVDGVGNVTPDEGRLRVHFSAADGDGLAVALLWRFGQTIGEMPLSGTQVEADFLTPYYETGSDGNYSVQVYDVQGNRGWCGFPSRAAGLQPRPASFDLGLPLALGGPAGGPGCIAQLRRGRSRRFAAGRVGPGRRRCVRHAADHAENLHLHPCRAGHADGHGADHRS